MFVELRNAVAYGLGSNEVSGVAEERREGIQNVEYSILNTQYPIVVALVGCLIQNWSLCIEYSLFLPFLCATSFCFSNLRVFYSEKSRQIHTI